MKTSFKYYVYLLAGISIISPSLILFISYQDGDWGTNRIAIQLTGIIIFLLFTFTELRTKVISVYLDKNEIRIKRFLGLGNETIFRLKDLDGYHTSIVTKRSREYEYLYFMHNGKKVAKISTLYHSNYRIFIEFCENNLTDLGPTDTTLLSELKDSVTF